MPLSMKSTSVVKFPRQGSNLLPAIAMLPREQSLHIVKNLALHQKKIVDRIRHTRKQIPITDCSKPTITYVSEEASKFKSRFRRDCGRQQESGSHSPSRTLGDESPQNTLMSHPGRYNDYRTSKDSAAEDIFKAIRIYDPVPVYSESIFDQLTRKRLAKNRDINISSEFEMLTRSQLGKASGTAKLNARSLRQSVDLFKKKEA